MVNSIIIFGAQYFFLFGIAIFLLYFGLLLRKREVTLQMLVFGFLSLAFAYVTAKIIGHFYFNPRPFVAEHFIPLIAHDNENGFPSDHTLLVSALASILYPYTKRISLLVFLVALLVGISRVYAGVHHSIDIAGSIVIVVIASLSAYKITEYLVKNRLHLK